MNQYFPYRKDGCHHHQSFAPNTNFPLTATKVWSEMVGCWDTRRCTTIRSRTGWMGPTSRRRSTSTGARRTWTWSTATWATSAAWTTSPRGSTTTSPSPSPSTASTCPSRYGTRTSQLCSGVFPTGRLSGNCWSSEISARLFRCGQKMCRMYDDHQFPDRRSIGNNPGSAITSKTGWNMLWSSEISARSCQHPNKLCRIVRRSIMNRSSTGCAYFHVFSIGRPRFEVSLYRATLNRGHPIFQVEISTQNSQFDISTWYWGRPKSGSPYIGNSRVGVALLGSRFREIMRIFHTCYNINLSNALETRF